MANSCIKIYFFLLSIGPYAFISYYEHTDGFNCAAFWSWIFFVLINAYYGGALTMFFTSELTLPFNSIGKSKFYFESSPPDGSHLKVS